MRISVKSLCAYIVSTFMSSGYQFATFKLEERMSSPSENKKVTGHLDFIPGRLIVEVNNSKNLSVSRRIKVYTYSPDVLWRLLQSYVIECAQYPARGRITWELDPMFISHDRLVSKGNIKLELSNNLIVSTKDVVIKDPHGADRMEPRAQMETPSEAQPHGQENCKCSLCCLTLTSDLSTDPDMESLKQLYLRSRDESTHHHGKSSFKPHVVLSGRHTY